MKLVSAILLALVALSSSSVSARKLRPSAAEQVDHGHEQGRDLYEDGWQKASPNGHVSGSCGCAGDAVKAILDAYKEKRNLLLPLQISYHATKTSRKLSLFIGKYMWLLVKYATYLLTDVDCGDCTGYPLGYCGAPTKEKSYKDDDDDWEVHLAPPSTYDCCCDVNQIRDLTINALCTLTENVVPRDPHYGDLILFYDEYEYKNYFYLLTAFEFFLCGAKAIYLTARPFCSAPVADEEVDLAGAEAAGVPTEEAFIADITEI